MTCTTQYTVLQHTWTHVHTLCYLTICFLFLPFLDSLWACLSTLEPSNDKDNHTRKFSRLLLFAYRDSSRYPKLVCSSKRFGPSFTNSFFKMMSWKSQAELFSSYLNIKYDNTAVFMPGLRHEHSTVYAWTLAFLYWGSIGSDLVRAQATRPWRLLGQSMNISSTITWLTYFVQIESQL